MGALKKTSVVFSKIATAPSRAIYLTALAAVLGAGPSYAGDFSLDWSVLSWPIGSQGPNQFTLTDQYGFEIQTTISASGDFASAPAGQTPYVDSIFGGNVESLIIVADPDFRDSNIGENTITATMSFSTGGSPMPVDGLLVNASDIDASDNNASNDRCDFITFTGDNGNPTLAAVSSDPVVLLGPGPGSGLTGLLGPNQAQCNYISGSATSPTSPNDDRGTVQATYPDNTSSISILYDESIGNVRGFGLTDNPAARGAGVLAEANFEVPQTISLVRAVSSPTASAGDTVTYTYTITNDGPLPFNTGQDLVIEDTLLGTVTCPAIGSPVAAGGTVVCSAPYTVTAADLVTGTVDSSATAGIGSISQPFISRLQSTPSSLPLIQEALTPQTGPQTCSPVDVFSAPITQLSGTGSAAAITTSDIFLFDNVTNDTNANPIDVVFQVNTISNASDIELNGALDAFMVANQNSNLIYTIRLVQDGTATPSNPYGTLITQSSINGVIAQQTDLDSVSNSSDSSDVGGFLTGAPTISYFNTAEITGFPTGGTAIAMDPAKAGNPNDWLDEINETAFDNYVTYEFDTFAEAQFIHGFTGTSTTTHQRGSGILLCAISNLSADVSAEDDDYTATPINTLAGGVAGDVFSNDTINSLPATAVNATLEVLTAAIPQNSGALVPFLETTGTDEGQVFVPTGVPAGVYTIEYRLCDAFNTDDCDRALITIAVFQGTGVDFGDAPVSYLTPSHGVSSSPTAYLGTVPPDSEVLAQSDATATADDALDIDDEDGVSFPVLTQGVAAIVDVVVTGPGFLQGWIDFNGDGLFSETGPERIATDLRDDGTGFDEVASDGVIQVNVSVPPEATTATTFARFRYGSEAGLSTSSFAVDGEVEDHSLVIAAADVVDRGDAPASYGDPRHFVVADIFLGAALPDSDVETLHSVLADGDDLNSNDDEDAIAAWPVLEAGTTVQLTVQTHETLSVQAELGIPVSAGVTNLQVWIDFNNDGAFDPGEQVATDYRDGGTGDTDGTFNNEITLNINVPNTISSGYTYARVRWSTSSGLVSDPFDGLNADGEVEDYRVILSAGAVPFSCDGTLYRVARVDSQLQRLVFSDDGSGGYTIDVDNVGGPAGAAFNGGWGYNAVNGLFYGVREFDRDLIQLDALGRFESVATIPATAATGYNSGDILSNGIMVYRIQNSDDFQLLDISDPINPIDAGRISLTSSVDPFDIAFNPNDGMVYGVNHVTDRMFFFDPQDGTPGTRTAVEFGPAIWTADYGAIWFDYFGRMYVNQNISNEIYAVDVGFQGTGTGDATLINTLSISEEFRNDGTGCPSPLGPLPPEGAISGTVFHDANNSTTFDAGDNGLPAITVTAYNSNNTPDNFADDTLVTSTQSAPDGTYRFDGLAAETVYRIEVSTSDLDIPAGYSVNTVNPYKIVRVTAGSETVGYDFGFTSTPSEADLSLTKEARDTGGAPITTAVAGQSIDFVLSVTNDSVGAATGVQVIDLLPDGYSYVSDDAAANGDTFNPSNGLWVVGDVASGATETLTIRVTMNAIGEHTNTAEIRASDLPDPDSDPNVGPLTDDLFDGIPDDDEAQVTIALTGGGATISGTVFRDNGAGSSFDGVQNGAEPGTKSASVAVYDNFSALIDTPEVAADGTWSLLLPAGYSDELNIVVTPDADHIVISETPAAFPGASNPDIRDGQLTFTPVANTDYTGLDIGLLQQARLNKSQESVIASGQVVELRHEYYADAQGTVSFSVATVTETPANGFSVALFEDIGCDGGADTVISGPLTTAADTLICVVARVSASGAAGPGARYVFDLTADTAYGATGVIEQDINTDQVSIDAEQGSLKLTKTVRNVTQGSAEGVSNGGALGDVLEYRIYLQNPTPVTVQNITIYDRTPPYTSLSAPISTPVSVGGGMTCSLALPVTNSAGYTGNLRWDCTGAFLPGAQGSVNFEVEISP